MNSTLTIISDTPMYDSPEGIHVFAPTLIEVEYLASRFQRIKWMGYLHPAAPPKNTRRPSQQSIELIPVPAMGGSQLIKKVRVALSSPRLAISIWKAFKGSTHIHARAPSVPAAICIALSWFTSKVWWFKYAGNWKQVNPPKTYALQRWLLSRAGHALVTVNGDWGDLPKHVRPFINPCLTDDDLANGQHHLAGKVFDGRLRVLFVGRIEEEKGVGLILKAMENPELRSVIESITFVGGGKQFEEFSMTSRHTAVRTQFRGTLSRDDVFDSYATAHLLLLPSGASEGFPKVIAEAAAFGCIPIVSDVSAVSQYVKDGETGYILDSLSVNSIHRCLAVATQDRDTLKRVAFQASFSIAPKFTFGQFLKDLEETFVFSPEHSHKE